MGTLPIPQETLVEAARLVDAALTKVRLKCTELRENTVTAVAALLVQKPESLRGRTQDHIALRCAHLANFAFDKAMRELNEGEDVVALAKEHFRTQVFVRSFP